MANGRPLGPPFLLKGVARQMKDSESTRSRAVGSPFPLGAMLAAVVALGVLIGGFAWWRSARAEGPVDRLVLATGPESGAYHALGVAMARLIEERGLVDAVEVRATQGSVENMRLLGSGEADLAIAQSDADPVDSVRLVATLFEEVLHVLLSPQAAGEIEAISDLDGRRISLGGAASGTRPVGLKFLDHFEISPSVDLEIDPAQALELLERGDLDAVFVLTAMPSVMVSELASGSEARFLSLGDAQEVGNEADAMALVYPRLHATNIPRGTYGRLPVEPVRTVGVSAQLLCRDDLPGGLVQQIVEAMFAGRSQLDDTDHSLAFGERLRELYDPSAEHLSYHPGAVAYYERFRPSFVVAYAEPISLGLTLLVGLWSASLALRQWLRRSRKNRIDAYYLEVVRDAPDLATADRDALRARQSRLLRIRERAFTDLVEERLDANESFSIFQSHIDGELASIERRLAAGG